MGEFLKNHLLSGNYLRNTMHEILKCFKLILCHSNLSKDYFNYFEANHAEIVGNLKFISL